ncbi:hypothetical protein [Wocania arenilitoris]|nr:hypothetical protein [Wocania arenilitoris]
MVKYIKIAPNITPIVKLAPSHTVLGMSSSIPAMSSKTPIPILS